MSFLSDLNPLNWGKDISNWASGTAHTIGHATKATFDQLFKDAMYYFISRLLQELLDAFSALFGLFDISIEGIISGIVYTVSFLGPAAMPIFIVLLVAIFAGLILLIGLVKDVPVVGAIV